MHRLVKALTIAAALIIAALVAPQVEARSSSSTGAAGSAGAASGTTAPSNFYLGSGLDYPPGYSAGPERYSPGPNGALARPLPVGSAQCWFWSDRDRGFGYWGPCP